MALFGSRFATGFITGLAETSNEALKDSIKRIRTNVDDLAKIQFDRALDDQEERKKEFNEAETALREAEAVFGKDPNAADYAGALLKESGSIAAFKQEIAKLRQAKQNNVPIVDFFNRAKQDAPSGTITDYAKAYVSSNRTLPSYKVPAGAVSTDGGLVSAIFGDIDVAGRVDKKVGEQMAAAGITQQQPMAFAPPAISYDREGLSMYQMTPSERIEYIKQELARPQNTQIRNDELNGMLNDNLNAAIKNSDRETKLSALQMQRSNAKTKDELAAINAEILKTQREIDLNQAITEKDKLEVQIKHAEEDGKKQEVITLRRQFEDMTNPVTLSVSLAREKEDLEIAMANNAMKPEDFDKALASIRKKENVLKEIGGENILDLADINAANTAIGNAMNDLLGNTLLDPAIETVKSDQDGMPIPMFKAGIDEDTKNRLIAAFDNARRVAINTYKTSMTEQENYKAVKAIEYVEKMYGVFNEAQIESGAESDDVTVGDTTIPSSVINSIAVANDSTTEKAAENISNTIKIYNPNDITSAAKFVQDAGDAVASEIAEIESYGIYSPEWIAAAKKAAGKSPVVDAVENTIDPQVTSAIDALEQGDFSALSGRMPKIKAIMSALNVSREDAQRLLPLAEAGLTKRKAQSSVSSGDASPREYKQLVQAAQTQSEYDAAVQAYSDSSNLDVDYIKKRYPFKQNKNQGGLMSRRGS